MIQIAKERLAQVQAHFEADLQLGGALSIWQGNNELLNLVGGYRDRERTLSWEAETLVPIWSCTKGPAAACVHAALTEAGSGIDEPVANIWPEFAQAGKGSVTVAQLLSHQAGLSALEHRVPIEDHQAVIAVLASQSPLWTLGTGHGYHPRTFGFLAEELVRRLTKAPSLGHYWRENLAEPLGLDVWIGLPPAEHHRVATVLPGQMGTQTSAEEAAFYAAFSDRKSLTQRSFSSPAGLCAVAEMNQADVWQAGYPAMGGVASACGLAAFYALLANGGNCAGTAFFQESQLDAMSTTLTSGYDHVLLRNTAFAAGFMKDPIDGHGYKTQHLFGPNTQAFGHPGAGGSHAFADPATGIGLAYVINQMERRVLPTEATLRMVRSLYVT